MFGQMYIILPNVASCSMYCNIAENETQIYNTLGYAIRKVFV